MDTALAEIGLALASTQRLFELQNGWIAAESGGRGRGATFCIELPLDTTALTSDFTAAVGLPAPSAQAAWRILLVEDPACLQFVTQKSMAESARASYRFGAGLSAKETKNQENKYDDRRGGKEVGGTLRKGRLRGGDQHAL